MSDEYNDQTFLEYSFDSQNSRIICLDIIKNKLGITVLDCSTGTLKIFPVDYTLSIKYDSGVYLNDELQKYSGEINTIAGQILSGLIPNLCIVSSRLNENSYQFISDKCNEINCKLELQSNQYFKKFENVLALEFDSKEENSILQNLIIHKDNRTKCTIGTVCCILFFYSQWYVGDNSHLHDTTIEHNDSNTVINFINKLEILDVNDKMLLGDDIFYSLQIFRSQHRTNYSNTVNKGAFSLYELLDYTLTSYGKTLLRSWLTFPLTDVIQIKKRYSMIKIWLASSNTVHFDDFRGCLKKCPDIFTVINQLKQGKETFQTWFNLNKFLTNAASIFQILCSLKCPDSDNLIFNIKTTIDGIKFHHLSQVLQKVIDFEISKELKRVIVSNNVDERLEELRIIAGHIEDLIIEEANITENIILDILTESQKDEICNTYKDKLTNFLFFPELSFLVTINTIVEDYFVGFSSLGWEEIFRTDTEIYFRTAQTESLTNKYGNIYSTIADIEIEILYNLKQELLLESDLFCRYYTLLGELDVYQSFAQVSKERNYIEPDITDKKCLIKITEGRHPLYETFLENYIPNDIYIEGGDFNDDEWNKHKNKRIQVLTGPNASGKSVYLSQVGLLIYMTQIGCFIPASTAEIGIVDKILTRIRTQESISKMQSSFEIDSEQISEALALCTDKSLLLIDEYGKGTDVIDGPALFGAIILYLSEKINCPRTIASTHFYGLFQADVLSTNIPGVSFYQTDIIQPDNIDIIKNITDENIGITFLFKIKEGISTNSLGIYCAQVCGMRREILSRASQLNERLEQGLDLFGEFQMITEEDRQSFAQKQKIIKAFLSWDLDLEANTSSDVLKKKLTDILSGEAAPLALRQDSTGNLL